MHKPLGVHKQANVHERIWSYDLVVDRIRSKGLRSCLGAEVN
jgi:hypothetical protein